MIKLNADDIFKAKWPKEKSNSVNWDENCELKENESHLNNHRRIID